MRMFLMAAALLACAVPAKAQQHDAHHTSGSHPAAGGEFPDGWPGRVGREGQKLENEPGQDHLYYLIRRHGSYLVRQRAGVEVHPDFALMPRE